MALEPSFERLGVHGVVVGLGRDDPSQAQAEDEGHRFVMPMRNAAAQTLAAPTVGGGVQDEANLIGERRAARRAVGGELSLVQLDEIFRLAASAVEGRVEPFG